MGLRLQELSVGYRSLRRWPSSGSDAVVLPKVSALAPRGAVTAVLGPNGAGKSTLLRTIIGLQPLLGGTVLLDSTDLIALPPRERARRAAVVLTDRVDVGLLTAYEVAELGRHPHRSLTSRMSEHERGLIMESLTRLHADSLASKRFAELSDGQRQRVLLARALVQEPELLILDEPSSYLDIGARVDLMSLLHQVARDRQMPVVISTHEVELALRTSDQIWLIDAGVLIQGTAEELIRSGAIGRVFETANTRFDAATRTFQARTADPRTGG
jgi:iron complex transport system ATP-binding protein